MQSFNLALSVILLINCNSVLGLSNVTQMEGTDPATRIVNGFVSESMPLHQVSLRKRSDMKHFCGGSIISNKYILTAAHCVSGASAPDIVAVVGSLTLDNGGEQFDIEKIISHRSYMMFPALRNDIALLKVSREFPADATTYKPIELCSSYTRGGVPLRLNGWGLTSVRL